VGSIFEALFENSPQGVAWLGRMSSFCCRNSQKTKDPTNESAIFGCSH